jgi:RES domain-containing protein
VLKIWRLEKERYVGEAFRGKGSLKTSGRWHRKGTQVACASEHPGVAVLEKLAWLGSYEVARDSSYLLVPLEIDPDEHLERIEEPELPQGWDAFPHRDETRDIGTGWFDEERSPVLGVPSAVLSIAENYLINPFHPQFHKLDRGEPEPFSWDRRLFQRGR